MLKKLCTQPSTHYPELRFSQFFSRTIRSRLSLSWFLGSVKIGLEILIPLQVSFITNLFISNTREETNTVTLAAVSLLVLSVALRLVILIDDLNAARIYNDIIRRVTLHLYRTVFNYSPRFFAAQNAQTMNVRFLEESGHVVKLWHSTWGKLPVAILSLAAFGLFMFLQNWLLAILMIPLSVGGACTSLLNRKLGETSRKMRSEWESIRAAADEVVVNYEELRANNATTYGLELLTKQYRQFCTEMLSMWKAESIAFTVPHLVSAVQIGVLFLLGIQMCSEGTLLSRIGPQCDWGTVIGFMFFLKLFQVPVESALRYLTKRHRRLESLKSINELLNAGSETFGQVIDKSEKSPPLINVQSLSVVTDSGAKILDDISLRIAPGEKLAITGPSGSGKSTLLRSIAGMVQPSKGCVLIDDIKAGSFSETLPRHSAFLSQRPIFFSWSIRDNILLGIRKPGSNRFDNGLEDLDLSGYPKITTLRGLDKLLLNLTETVGLTEDMFSRGLDRRLSNRLFDATEVGLGYITNQVKQRIQDRQIILDVEKPVTKSLRYDILGGKPRYVSEAVSQEIEKIIYEVCHKFGFAKNVVLSGLASPLKLKNSGLSGGQEQKVALARALIRKPGLLLLDEAVANLDKQSKKKVLNNLGKLSATVVFVSHDETEIVTATRKIVIERGKLQNNRQGAPSPELTSISQ